MTTLSGALCFNAWRLTTSRTVPRRGVFRSKTSASSWDLFTMLSPLICELQLNINISRSTKDTHNASYLTTNYTINSTLLSYVKKLRKAQLLMKLHLRASGCHLPIQCHLPYGITHQPMQVNAPHLNPSQRPVLDLLTPEQRKAELT